MYGNCRWICHTWIPWDIYSITNHVAFLAILNDLPFHQQKGREHPCSHRGGLLSSFVKKGQGSTQDLPCLLVGLGLGKLCFQQSMCSEGRPFKSSRDRFFWGHDSIPTAPHCGICLRKNWEQCEMYLNFPTIPDSSKVSILRTRTPASYTGSFTPPLEGPRILWVIEIRST